MRKAHNSRKSLSTLGVLLSLIFCTNVIAQELPDDEYACLSDVLRHGLANETKQVVIANLTSGDPSAIVDGSLPSEARATELNTNVELLREWARLNQTTHPLAASFTLPVPYILLTESDRDLLFRGDNPEAGWKLFFARYANSPGLLRVSRVAFDSTKTHALLYLELQCGAECGAGRLIQAKRVADGPWEIEFGELMWVAGPKS
ncbi:MAG: hypothetical protein EXR86_07310 [Gammaproteobacteria bacterium]|nr:hypothetical protein [Gammaproteobacteria bacterium]